jgi:hypothetical protein
MSLPTLTYDGKEIRIVRFGTFQCCVEYVHLFKNLERRPGNASSRQFFVLTSTLDTENDICLRDHHQIDPDL